MFDKRGSSVSAEVLCLQHMAFGCWSIVVRAETEVVADNAVLGRLRGLFRVGLGSVSPWSSLMGQVTGSVSGFLVKLRLPLKKTED